MSDADRQRWNARYAQGSHADQSRPCGVLQAHLHLAPPGQALDVACGAGRNALFMAQHGYVVDALDVSAVALELGAQAATRHGLQASVINWRCVDLLDARQPVDALGSARDYQLVLLCHFIAPELLRRLPEFLAPGGILMVEEHLRWPTVVAGPGSARFRVEPGSLRKLLLSNAPDLQVEYEFEGLVPNSTDPDTESALARLVVRKPL